MSFNLSNFAMSGNAVLRYTTPDGGSVGIGNLAASRSDNVDAPFADPYRLDVISGGPGRADIVNIAMPQNLLGREAWQIAFDFDVERRRHHGAGRQRDPEGPDLLRRRHPVVDPDRRRRPGLRPVHAHGNRQPGAAAERP
jgi:hypothetical protein